MKNDFDWSNLKYGCCPKCPGTVTMKEFRDQEKVGCLECGFKMDAQKFWKRCSPKSFWGYQVKNRSLSEDEIMSEICQLA